MNTVLLSAGVACLILTVVGGGASAFGVQVPVLSSVGRQVFLGLLGLAFLAGAWLLRDQPTVDDGKVAAYRQEVLATCRAVSPGDRANALLAAQNRDGTYDRTRFSRALRDQIAAAEGSLIELWRRPPPADLQADAAAAHAAADAAIGKTKAAVDAIPEQMPRRFTVSDFAAFAARLDRALRPVEARFESSMSRLAGAPCRPSSAPATG